MIVRSYFLRLSQLMAASSTVFLLVMIGTLLLQRQIGEAISLSLIASITAFWWLVASVIVSKVDPELTIEVARLLYPTVGLLSLLLSIVLGLVLIEMVTHPVSQHISVILAGILFLIVMGIKCFDIRWLRSAEELHFVRRQGEKTNENL